MSEALRGSTVSPIIPHLWFDTEAREAAEFYCSIFPQSTVTNVSTLYDTPSGDSDIVSFTVWGQPFMAISAGPYFTFNPSISFFVNFDPSREPNASAMLDDLWHKLADGGKALMPLDEYPFSQKYGWVQDQYGVSWQLILTDPSGEPRPPIVPSLLFVGDNNGKAEEARSFYLSVFRNSQAGPLFHYGPGQEPDGEHSVMFTDFRLENSWLAAMDSAREHGYGFNEAISLLIHCETQEAIDYYWDKLSAVPEAEQCGWLKDPYGVSWQVSPTSMDDMLANGTKEQVERVTKAFLKMKKFNLAELQRAFEGE